MGERIYKTTEEQRRKDRERRRKQRIANPEAYLEAHRARDRKYRTAHPERARESRRAALIKWRSVNHEKSLELARIWKAAHREQLHEYNRKKRAANPEKAHEADRKRRVAHREEMREADRRRHAKHPEKSHERNRRWRAENAEYRREYMKDYRATNFNAKMAGILSGRLRWALNRVAKKSACALKLLGCTVAEFRVHIERQFKPGMTWGNYGHRGWHIDHIIPCAVFNLTDPEQQKVCFHYTNMQPLWASENLKKGAHFEIHPSADDDTD